MFLPLQIWVSIIYHIFIWISLWPSVVCCQWYLLLLWANLLSSRFLVDCDRRNWKPGPKTLYTLSKALDNSQSSIWLWVVVIWGLHNCFSNVSFFVPSFSIHWGGHTPPVKGVLRHTHILSNRSNLIHQGKMVLLCLIAVLRNWGQRLAYACTYRSPIEWLCLCIAVFQVNASGRKFHVILWMYKFGSKSFNTYNKHFFDFN